MGSTALCLLFAQRGDEFVESARIGVSFLRMVRGKMTSLTHSKIIEKSVANDHLPFDELSYSRPDFIELRCWQKVAAGQLWTGFYRPSSPPPPPFSSPDSSSPGRIPELFVL
jgi:hypothetical protein